MPYLRPSADVNVGVWETQSGSQFNVFESIDEDVLNTSDFAVAVAEPLAGDLAMPYTFGFQSATKPSFNHGHLLEVWVSGFFSGSAALRVELLDGTTVRSTAEFFLSASGNVELKQLAPTEGEIAAIGAYTNLRGRVTLLPNGTQWQLVLYKASFWWGFAHLDYNPSAPGLIMVNPNSGHYLGIDGMAYKRIAGREGIGALILTNGNIQASPSD